MAIRIRSPPLIALFLLIVIFAFTAPTPVHSTHFAFGTISWVKTSIGSTNMNVLITVQQAWRTDYGWKPSNPSQSGDTVDLINPIYCWSEVDWNTANTKHSGVNHNTNYGSDQMDIYSPLTTTDYVGNQYNKGSPYYPKLTVANVYPADWFAGTFTITLKDLPYTESGTAINLYYVEFWSCCRISTLSDNNANIFDGTYAYIPTAQALVSSFNTSNAPRQYGIPNVPINFQLLWASPANVVGMVQLSSTTNPDPNDSYLNTASPSGFSINANTGVVQWTPTATGYFAVSMEIYETTYNHAIVLDTVFDINNTAIAYPTLDPLNSPWTFYPNVQGIFPVTGTITIPGDSVNLYMGVAPTGAVFTPTSQTGQTATYDFIWTPAPGQYGQVVCFWAIDTLYQIQSLGNACALLQIGQGSLLLVNGIVRDFHNTKNTPNLNPDFGHASSGDTTSPFVSSTLGTGSVVAWNPSANPAPTTTTEANFAWWYNTDPTSEINEQMIYTLVLNNATQIGTPNPRVYTYAAPFEPINNDLFGNEGDSYNRFFTFEAHTYVTYLGGEVLQFGSSDDFWIFFNGQLPASWNEEGIPLVQTGQNPPVRTYTAKLDTVLGSSYLGKTVPVDIFFAHRSSANTPFLQIQLVPYVACNALSQGTLQIAFGQLTQTLGTPTAPSILLLGASSIVSNEIEIIPASPSTYGIGWFGTGTSPSASPQRLKVLHGFKATFSFVWAGTTEGFAFCMQAQSATAQGGQTYDLGYGGGTGIGLTNSVCVEFDGVQESQYNDPTWDHVSFHSQLTAANDAHEGNFPTGFTATYSNNNIPLHFENGTIHNAVITFSPPVEGSGLQVGNLYAYVSIYPNPDQVLQTPTATAQINSTILSQMWSGSAWVGFTASTSAANYKSITIINATMTAVPASALYSKATTLPQGVITAGGNPGYMVIQLYDVCQNPITLGGDGSDLTGVVTYLGNYPLSPTPTGVTIPTYYGTFVDNENGTYGVTFSPQYAGSYKIDIQLTGQSISGSPFQFLVQAGPPAAPQSIFNVSFANVNAGFVQVNTSLMTLVVLARDQFTNPNLFGGSQFSLSFSPDLTSPGYNPVMSASTDGLYRNYISSNIAGSNIQMYIQLNGGNIAQGQPMLPFNGVNFIGSIPYSLTFNPGQSSAITSVASGTGLNIATAGQATSFTIILKDIYSNTLFEPNPYDHYCTATETKNPCYIQLVSTNTKVSVVCAWSYNVGGAQCTYTATVAGSYTFLVYINGAELVSVEGLTLTVQPAVVYAPLCFVTPGGLSVVAGTPATFTIMQRDMYNNSISIPIPGNGDFSLSIYGASFTVIYGQPSYVSNGAYSFTLSATTTGTFDASITLNTVGIHGSPIVGTVLPAGPSALSQFTYSAATITASTTPYSSTIQINSIDQYGNYRIHGGQGSDYSVSMSPQFVGSVVVGTVSSTTNQYYSGTYGAMVAGKYSLHVQVTSSAADIVNSPVTITVNPGPTYAMACTASGSGLTQGYQSQATSFIIQAADQFGNPQTVVQNDLFEVSIVSGGETVQVVNASLLASPASSGQHPVTYTAPSSGTTYQIVVKFLSPQGWESIGPSPFTATLYQSPTSLTVTIANQQYYPNGIIGVSNTIYIYDSSNTEDKYGSTLQCLLYSSDRSIYVSYTASNGGLASTNFSLVYKPTFLISETPLYLNVSRGIISSSTNPFKISYVHGPMSAEQSTVSVISSVSAGTMFNVTVGAYDAGMNPVTGGVETSISVVFQGLTYKINANITRGANGDCSYCTSECGACPAGTSFSYSGHTVLLFTSLTTADTFTVTVFMSTSSVVSSQLYSLLVIPGAPSLSTSTLLWPSNTPGESPALPLAAGSSAQFELFLCDQYGNGISPSDYSGNIDSLVSVAMNGTVGDYSIGTVFSNVAPGYYTNSVVNSKTSTNPYALIASLNGEPLTTPPLLLYASFGPISSNGASVSIVSTTNPTDPQANDKLKITVEAFDIYGNPWGNSLQQVTAFPYAPSQSYDGVTNATLVGSVASSLTFQPGTFQWVGYFQYTQFAGWYLFQLSADSTTIASTYFFVAPTAIVAANTVVPVQLPNGQAGVESSFNLQFRDIYLNVIPSTYSRRLTSVGTSFVMVSSVVINCQLIGTDLGVKFTTPPPSAWESNSDSFAMGTPNYVVGWTAFTSGVWVANFTVNGALLPCSLMSHLVSTVVAGPPFAANSYIYDLPSSMVAGVAVTVYGYFADEWMNPTATDLDAVEVAALTVSQATFDNKYVQQSTMWWFKGNFTDPRQYDTSPVTGIYNLILYTTVDGTYSVIVSIGDSLLVSYNTNDVVVNPNIVVNPNVGTDIVFGVPSPIIAGRPFTVSLTLTDIYGNVITTGLSNPNTSLSVFGRVLNPPVVFYGVLTPPTSSEYFWTATSQWNGSALISAEYIDYIENVDHVSTVGINIRYPLCGAIDPSMSYTCPDGTCVSSLDNCAAQFQQNCPTNVPIKCSVGNVCVVDGFDCPCPGDFMRCQSSGVCINPAEESCPEPLQCPTGLVLCTVTLTAGGSVDTGQCASSSSACAPRPTCNQLDVMCPDLTCAPSPASCYDTATVLSGVEVSTIESTMSSPTGPSVTIQVYPPLTMNYTYCPTGTYRCLSGQCTSLVSDCSSQPTCPSMDVLCGSDESCQTMASVCPSSSLLQCYNPSIPWKCADGACAASPSDCPVATTCPMNYILCPSGSCASSLSSCPPMSSSVAAIPLQTVSCPDGSAAISLSMCPTMTTCPTLQPVQCPDGSCEATASLCPSPSVCPLGDNGAVCPDGSCVEGMAQCGTLSSCPSSYPTKCLDGTCVTSVSLCPTVPECSATSSTPFRCPDGSCRRGIADCPTESECPSSEPIRCPDGSCQYTTDSCPIPTTVVNPTVGPFGCPSGEFHCPSGECTTSQAFCPTIVTCPAGSSRCSDGSCRLVCPSTYSSLCQSSNSNLLQCPQTSTGFVCVTDLSQCPPSVICPAASPVKCIDSTCAQSALLCPPLPPQLNTTTPTTLLPCPDGSWLSDLAFCSTPVSCPPSLPYVCVDSTCRANPADCPTFSPCNQTSSTPYRCSNGECVSSPVDAQCAPTGAAVAVCSSTTPIHCSGSGAAVECVANIGQCGTFPDELPSLATTTMLNVSSLNPSQVISSCPPGYIVCRSGICVSTGTSCDDIACPSNLPYLCDAGVCAADANHCPGDLSTCYEYSGAAAPFPCWNGDCYEDPSFCPMEPINGYCLDGSLLPTGDTQVDCASNYRNCDLRCPDGSCGLYTPVGQPSINLCQASYLPEGLPSQLQLGNVCPSATPYRCSSGLCVQTSLDCPILPSFTCPSTSPFQCADGQCLYDGSQCPIVRQCYSNEYRCADGQCRATMLGPEGDPHNTCPDGGNMALNHSCPIFTQYGATNGYRCQNGLCSVTGNADGCPSLLTGCPQFASVRCANGACVATSSLCSTASTEFPSPSGNGCPATTPYKCLNGQCVANNSTCLLANGCPSSLPYRCTQTDNSCQTSIMNCPPNPPACSMTCADGACPPNNQVSQCTALNGCPVATPYRCADGSCKANPATAASNPGVNPSTVCPITFTCPSSEFLCADGSCQASSSLCAPVVLGCGASQVLCSDGSCATSLSACVPYSKVTTCPAGSSLCSTGQCATSAIDCPNYSSPGTSVGGGSATTLPSGLGQGVSSSGASSASNPNSPVPPTNLGTAGSSVSSSENSRCSNGYVECFDGSCRASYSACQNFSLTIYKEGGGGEGVGSTYLSEVICDDFNISNPRVFCPNGMCASSTCPSLAIPPSSDGTNNPFACIEEGCGVVAACPLTLPVRCPDGSCTATECDAVEACPAIQVEEGYEYVQTIRCEDGSCRLKCLPFDGCPLSLPFHCANRECAVSGDQCSSEAVGVAPQFEGFITQLTTFPFMFPLNTLDTSLIDPSTPDLPAYSGNTAVTSSLVTNCYSSCQSQLMATAASFQLNPSQALTVSVTVDSNLVVQSQLTIPAFAIQSISGSPVVLEIYPVSASEIRSAENHVSENRAADVGSEYLTYPQTVISSPFRLTAQNPSDIVEPFNIGLALQSTVDLNSVGSAVDVCLAQMISDPTILYEYWQCINQDSRGTIAASPRNPSVAGNTPPSQMFGTIQQQGVYAFVYNPYAVNSVSSQVNIILYVVIAVVGGAIVVFLVAYTGSRFYRYRAKYHAERLEVARKAEEVAEMEQFGGSAGIKDEEVMMLTNPMVMQMKDLAIKLANNREHLEAEQRRAAEYNEERQRHIVQLETDRRDLENELRELEKQMRKKNQAIKSAGPAGMDMDMEMMAINAQRGPVETDSTDYEGETNGHARVESVTLSMGVGMNNVMVAQPRQKKQFDDE